MQLATTRVWTSKCAGVFFSTRFAGMLHHTLHVFDVRDLRQSWILDSTLRFRVPVTGFLFFSVILGFGIVIFNKIPNFLNCIPDSRTKDSGFHKEIFPIFRIPQPTFSRKAHKPPSYIYEGNLLRQQRWPMFPPCVWRHLHPRRVFYTKITK